MDDQRKKFLDHWMEYHEICQRQRLGWKPTQIAEFLGLDARTVKKYLTMTDDEYVAYREKLVQRSRKLDTYEDFVVKRLIDCDEASAAQVHDWLKENHPGFPDVDEKTVYSFVLMVRQKHNIPKAFSSLFPEIECDSSFNESGLPITPGINRAVASIITIAATSPPPKT